jgi:hypothetical protein
MTDEEEADLTDRTDRQLILDHVGPLAAPIIEPESDPSSEDMEIIRSRAGGPGHPWVPAHPQAIAPLRRRGVEDI